MKHSMHDWIANLIAAPKKRAMPILSFPCISLMDISVEQLTADASLQAQGMKMVADRTPACAAVSMMDLSVEAEAFGAKAQFLPGEVPTVKDVLVRSMEEAQALNVPAVGAGRTGKYVQAIREACQLITDRPVFAGIIGPYSLAGRLMGVSDIMMDCYEEPETVHAVLQKATDFLIAYAQAYKEAGAHGIVMAEPLSGLLSPALAEEFSEPYVRAIAQAVKSDDFLVIYHNCGNNTPFMLESILRTQCDGYHFGDAISMAEIISKIPADVLVMGNVSPSTQFLFGTPESMRECTLQLMKDYCPQHPNFVVSSGCDIPPLSPWKNIDAFFAAVEEYYNNKQ